MALGMSERLAFVLSLDADGAIRGFRQVGDTANRELGQVENRLDRVGTRMQVAGAGAVAFAGVAGRALFELAQDSASLSAAQDTTNRVFGEASGIVDEFARDSVEGFGLSERAFRESTNQLGAFLTNLGFTRTEAASASVDLARVGADLAAAFDTTPAQAISAIGSAIRGERDPIERFGISLKQADVDARALAMGLDMSTSEAETNARAVATLALIQEQAASTAGTWAAEGDQLIGQQAKLAAEVENLRAEIGEGAVPVMSSFVALARSGIDVMSGLNDATGGSLGGLATWATAVAGAAGALGLLGGTALRSVDHLREMRTRVNALSGPMGTMTRAFGAAGVAAAGATTAFAIWSKAMADAQARVDEFGAGIRSTLSTETIDELRASVGELDAGIQDLLDTADSSSAPWDADYRAELRKGADELNNIRNETIGLITRVQELSRVTGVSEDQALQLIRAQEELGLSAQQASPELQRLFETMDPDEAATLARELGVTEDQLDQVARQAGVTADELTDLQETVTSLTDAVLGAANSDLAYRESVLATEEAQRKQVEAYLVAAEAGFANKEANLAAEEATNRLEGAMLAQAEAAARVAVDQAEANGQTLTAQERNAVLREELGKVAGTLAPDSPLRARLLGYVSDLESVPDEITTELRVNVDQPSFSNARSALGALGSTALRALGEAGVSVSTGRARGGMLDEGEATLVGEEGPEVVRRRGGSLEVLTAGRTLRGDQDMRPAAPARSGGGLHLEVHGDVHFGSDPAQVKADLDVWALSRLAGV